MTQQLLVVQIGAYRWAVSPGHVQEIVARPRVTRIPQTRPILAGVVVMRGQPLPVVVPHPLWGDPAPETVRYAMRWHTEQGPVLVGVDAVDTLWTVTDDPLPVSAWSGVVPAELHSFIDAVYRRDTAWIWVAPPTWPILLLQRGGPDHAMA